MSIKDRSWMVAAECRNHPSPEDFFPEGKNKFARINIAREALQLCAVCPVAAQCREYAVEVGCGYGIWGGAMPSPAQQKPSHGSRRAAPHGTVARARKHYRDGEKPCGPCAAAQTRDSTRRNHRKQAS